MDKSDDSKHVNAQPVHSCFRRQVPRHLHRCVPCSRRSRLICRGCSWRVNLIPAVIRILTLASIVFGHFS